MVRSEDYSIDVIRRRKDSVEMIFDGPLRPASVKDYWGVVVQCNVMPRFRFRRSICSGGTNSSRP